MEHPYLASIKTFTTQTYGETGRASKRRLDVDRGYAAVDQFIVNRLPELAALPPKTISDNDFLMRAAELFVVLNESIPQRAFVPAWGRFCRFVDTGNSEGSWKLPAIGRALQLPTESLLRNANWQRDAIRLQLADAQLMAGLERWQPEQARHANVLLGLIVYFAATRGGLSDPSALVALVDAVHQKQPIFVGPTKKTVWMPLALREDVYTNITVNGEKMRQVRFFPDPFTLALMRVYRDSDLKPEEDSWDRNRIIGWVNAGLQAVNLNISSFGSLMQLGRVALSTEERFTPIPEALYEASFGRNRQLGLPESYWRAVHLITPLSTPDWGAPMIPIDSATSETPGKPHRPAATVSNEKVYSTLWDIVRNPRRLNTDDAKRDAIKGLKSLQTSDWPLAGQMLHAWGLYHLHEKDHALTTIRTYYSKYGLDLLAAMHDADHWDPDDLYEVYQSIINGKRNRDSQDEIAYRLAHFHEFARARFGLPGLLEPLTAGHAKRVHVRAAFIPEYIYRLGLSLIPKLSGRSKHYRSQLRILWMLAYRTGLRRNELLRIQLKDIEKSEEQFLFVRNNYVARGKTSSARRKIPLAVLLTKRERKQFNQLLAHLRAQDKSGRSLLLSSETSRKDRMNPKYVSNDVVRILNELGFAGSLHSFRHTTLTRLQLIAEREWQMVEAFSTYTQAEAEAIYAAVFDNPYVSHERYRALAAFAGHASPAITFNSYLHLSAEIVHERLRRSEQTYSRSVVSALTGLTIRKLNKLARKHAVAGDTISMQVFRDAVVTECRDLLTPLFPQKKPKAPDIDEISITAPPRTISGVYDCLADWQKGVEIEQLPFDHGLKCSDIERYIANGRTLAKEMTQKGHSRLVSRRRHGERPVILPGALTNRLLREEAISIAESFRRIYTSQRTDIEWAIAYFLTHSNTTEPYVSFTEPDDLTRFLDVCDAAIGRACWRFELTMNSGDNSGSVGKSWGLKKADNTSFVESQGGVRGYRARLYYRYPQESRLITTYNKTVHCKWKDPTKRKKKKAVFRSEIATYSASTLRYLFWMMGIMMFKTETLAQLLDNVRATKPKT